MKPPPFGYTRPRSLDNALAALAEHGADARPLAGGQSLIPLLNLRLARPSLLVDLNGVPGLADQRLDDGWLVLGAMVRQRALERDPQIGTHVPLLSQAARLAGSSSHPEPWYPLRQPRARRPISGVSCGRARARRRAGRTEHLS